MRHEVGFKKDLCEREDAPQYLWRWSLVSWLLDLLVVRRSANRCVLPMSDTVCVLERPKGLGIKCIHVSTDTSAAKAMSQRASARKRANAGHSL